MGMPILHYGSVFLYKNGFRIHPFGDPNEDSLGIDRRKQQGFFRFLGTRDLSGRIEIYGINPAFRETSSRDGGVIKNEAYEQLRGFFIECALRRLEAFVVNLQQFGEGGDLPDPDKLTEAEIRQGIFDVIAKLTQAKNVIDISYNHDVLDLLQNSSESSVTSLLTNLRRIAAEQPRPELSREVAKAEKQLARLAKAKAEAESETVKERVRAKAAEEKARVAQQKAAAAEAATREAQEIAQQATSQNLFLKSALSKDLQHVMQMHHSIGQDALTIENYISNALAAITSGKPVKPEQMRVPLERISYLAKRISTLSRYATRANFRADSEDMSMDVVEYVREYLQNVYGGFVMSPQRAMIPIRFHHPSSASFSGVFAPINIGIVLDNLISNARKHGVKNIDVSVLECSADRLRLSFRDDGDGIPKRNLAKLFDIGFSTTEGSGLGLHHVREVLKDLNGTIEANPDAKNGAEFIITINPRS
jgi:signal transduction histidine kinase